MFINDETEIEKRKIWYIDGTRMGGERKRETIDGMIKCKALRMK